MLHGVREEVGVHEDGVGGDEGGVVLEEEGGGDLRAARLLGSWCGKRAFVDVHFADDFVAFSFAFAFYFALCLVLFPRSWHVRKSALDRQASVFMDTHSRASPWPMTLLT